MKNKSSANLTLESAFGANKEKTTQKESSHVIKFAVDLSEGSYPAGLIRYFTDKKQIVPAL